MASLFLLPLKGGRFMLIISPSKNTVINDFASAKISSVAKPGSSAFKLSLTGFDDTRIEIVYPSSADASSALHEIINAILDGKRVFFLQQKIKRR